MLCCIISAVHPQPRASISYGERSHNFIVAHDAHTLQIGHALRLALEYGMHTEMHGICLDVDFVQRSRLVWWTVYVLERRMSSLLGVPMGISEESISASFPSASTLGQSSIVLEMQVMLCQILAKVDLSKFLPPL